MIDPVLSLALSMHASPGVFAVLIGSGMSRGAGIMTGWEITLDLAQRVATASGENAGRDPAAWFTKRFGHEPSYSDLLAKLARSSAERQLMLRRYFEPTDEEREQGLKLPTLAHRGIAKLAAAGYVRLILTTNFDRLMELALEDEGVRPVVVASPDAIVGAPPLVHSSCTVVKVHGDYLDTRILNTTEELARYDRRLSRYLDRIVDDYGWLIIGWSAEWDTALRGVFERARGRRYSMYWAARGGEVRDHAKRLTDARGAEVLAIKDADTFVTSLEERVQSIVDSSAPNPMSLASVIYADVGINRTMPTWHLCRVGPSRELGWRREVGIITGSPGRRGGCRGVDNARAW